MNSHIGIDENNYPGLLKEIPNAPKYLYYKGDENLLAWPKLVAVVGSRQMTGYGKKVIERLVPELVRRGAGVVSGMAFGVDARAHNVCLDCGGKTIAVLASGVDVASPKGNCQLYERILREGGLIVSEYSDGSQVDRVKFLERNRIVAGLCSLIIVVEGRQKEWNLGDSSAGFRLWKRSVGCSRPD
ncbi:MAG: DNA-processing protein DprA [Patescibacteria group bacterium]